MIHDATRCRRCIANLNQRRIRANLPPITRVPPRDETNFYPVGTDW